MKIKIYKIISFWLLFIVCRLSSIAYASEKVRIAIVNTGEREAYNQTVAGFKKWFADTGVTVLPSEYNLDGEDRKGRIICEEIKNNKPDIIFTIGTLASRVVGGNIENIPIVFCMVLDPSSIVKKPNVTGVLMDIPLETRCEYFSRILPKVKKIGVIYTAKTESMLEEMAAYSKKTGCQIISKKISSEKEFPESLEALSWQIDAFLMVPDPAIYTIHSTKYLIIQSLNRKTALVGLSSPYTKAGALYSLDCDYEDMGRQAGEIALKVIRGENIGNIPVVYPRKARLSLNLITADNIGIKISQTVLKEAAEVYGR